MLPSVRIRVLEKNWIVHINWCCGINHLWSYPEECTYSLQILSLVYRLCQGLEWMMSRLKIRWFLMTPLHRHCFKKKSCTRGYPHSGRIAGLGVFIMNWFQLYFLRRYTHIHTYINSDRSAKRKMQLMAQFVFLVVFLWRCVWKQWSAFLPRYSHWEQSDAECGEDEARERSYALGFHYYIVVLSSQRCGFVNFSKLANKSMA